MKLVRLSRPYVVAKLWTAYLHTFVHPPRQLFEVPGYLRPVEGKFLYRLASKVPAGGVALEVGSFKGRSSSFLAAGLKDGATLACVDTWSNDAMPYDEPSDIMSEFLENTKPYSDRIRILRGSSAEIGARWADRIDVLFIDGDHS